MLNPFSESVWLLSFFKTPAVGTLKGTGKTDGKKQMIIWVLEWRLLKLLGP